jgi:hypothetical protein
VNKHFAVSSFFVLDDHQLALVKLSDVQVARYQRLRLQLERLRYLDDSVCEIVVNDNPVLWLPYDEALQFLEHETITEAEYLAKAAQRGEDYSEPDHCYVHINVHGVSFSGVWPADSAETATIDWATVEAP